MSCHSRTISRSSALALSGCRPLPWRPGASGSSSEMTPPWPLRCWVSSQVASLSAKRGAGPRLSASSALDSSQATTLASLDNKGSADTLSARSWRKVRLSSASSTSGPPVPAAAPSLQYRHQIRCQVAAWASISAARDLRCIKCAGRCTCCAVSSLRACARCWHMVSSMPTADLGSALPLSSWLMTSANSESSGALTACSSYSMVTGLPYARAMLVAGCWPRSS
mmetsp:Transcript_33440/g.73946  ORF Transcript_33440/g.73946 Transcript_33440/m.73946 type:complete len:224 (-) Transcript_33440:393-1064(-)